VKSTLRTIAAGVNHAVRRVHVDVNPDLRTTTLVAGTGRSGTAWAANVANYDNRSRYMFEPFNPYKVRAVAHFRYRQYLRPDNDDERYLGPARRILTGRIACDWIDQFNRAVVSRSRIIKEIRVNLMLKWLKRHFPEIRLVMMMRHPCADANSRLHLGWQSHLDELLAQDDLVRDHLAPFVEPMRAAATQFERHVFLWCAENYVPLRQLESGDVHLMFYENLCESPKREVEKLFAFLEKPVTPAVFKRLSQPSELAREESAVVRGASLVDGWRKSVEPSQARRALEILALFGLDAIYSLDTSMPDVGGALALLGGGARSAPASAS
jgi:sulfotransferase family protein